MVDNCYNLCCLPLCQQVDCAVSSKGSWATRSGTRCLWLCCRSSTPCCVMAESLCGRITVVMLSTARAVPLVDAPGTSVMPLEWFILLSPTTFDVAPAWSFIVVALCNNTESELSPVVPVLNASALLCVVSDSGNQNLVSCSYSSPLPFFPSFVCLA